MLRGLRERGPPRLMVVLGASGAGKSSFLRAGLLPRLARQDHHFLMLPVIRPARAPISGETGLIASLARAIKTAGLPTTRAALRTAVREGPEALKTVLSNLAGRGQVVQSGEFEHLGVKPTIVLAIDQAEELFSADRADEASALMSLLGSLVAQDDLAIIAIFTVRTDSFELLQTSKHLGPLRQFTLSLQPMPRGAFGEVIKRPASRLRESSRSLRIEESLVDAIMSDLELGESKDALPLLAFTMGRLYQEYGQEGVLTLDNYREMGGLRCASASVSDPTTARSAPIRGQLSTNDVLDG
jgi:hypothetical protein